MSREDKERLEESKVADDNDEDNTTAVSDEAALLQDMSQAEEEPVIDTPTGIPLVTEHIISVSI